MWKNRLAYGLVLLTAAVLLFLYSKPFLLTVLIVLLLLMVINGVLVLHDAHSIRVSMRVRPGGQQGKDVNLNIIVNSDKKLLAAQEIFLELETQSTQLVQQHITFSAAVPTRNGLEIYEVRTQKDFQQMLMHWMCFPLQQTEGAGMRYFLTQQMDRQYARLVLLTAGPYTASLKPLEGRIGTTVISAVSGGKLQHIAVGGGYEVVELPAERIEDEVYRILC